MISLRFFLNQVFVLALYPLLSGAFPTDPQLPAPAAPQSTAGKAADFVIGVEDVLAVNVWKDPELSVREVVVRPDGKISLPLAGEILTSGLTVRQLQDAIAEKLKDYINSPVVTVTVVRIASQSVSVVGQVGKPGTYPLISPTTVMELLAKAGGIGLDAKSKKIKIIRKEDGKETVLPFNYNEIAAGKNLKQNILLKNGDIVVVP